MTFLEKYTLLKKSIPVPAVTFVGNMDSSYSNFMWLCKNCQYCFHGYKLYDSLYAIHAWGQTLVDCLYVTESENCYECVECTKCYGSTYLIEGNNSTNCHFSALLSSCTDCFGCVGLTNKKYCIFNKQFSKGDYFEKLEELKKEPSEKILTHMFDLKKQIPHPASQQANTENCPYGNYIYDSKNSYWCFNSYYIENSGYNTFSGWAKNCWDVFLFGEPNGVNELCYEHFYTARCFNSAFLTHSTDCTNCHNSTYLRNCSDCFGCVGLANKKYCILNNQLTKDQYEIAVKEIKKELGWKN